MSESDAIRRLTRWENAGGRWQVVSHAGSHVTIALHSCDGGEEMERFDSADAELLALIADRRSCSPSAAASEQCE